MAKRLTKSVLVIGLVAALAAIVVLHHSSSHAPPPMPNPNGYDEIVQAGIALSSNFWTHQTMGTDELRIALKANAKAIAQGHEALKLDSRVRLHPPSTNDVDEAMAPINLSEAFAAQAQLSELENRLQDAKDCYLDMARLGYQSSRGGLVDNGLQGIDLECQSTFYLEKLSAKLDANSCKEIVGALQSLDSKNESIAAYEREEKAFEHEIAPGPGVLAWFYIQFAFRESRKKAENAYAKRQTIYRQNMIKIAARAYQLERNRTPAKIADLVPNYLGAVPKNGTNGTDMTLAP